MAKANTTTGAQGATTVARIDPTNDASTLADTLSYAMQDNADPRHVQREIIEVVERYCQNRSTLGHLRSLLHVLGRMLDGEQFKLHPEPDDSTPQEMDAIAIYDGLAKCITQSRGIVGCLGSLDLNGPLDDLSLGNASWAVKDLLEQASTYASALLKIAKLQEGGAA